MKHLALALVILGVLLSLLSPWEKKATFLPKEKTEKEIFNIGKRFPAGTIEHQTLGKLPKALEVLDVPQVQSQPAIISEKIEEPARKLRKIEEDRRVLPTKKNLSQSFQNFVTPAPFVNKEVSAKKDSSVMHFMYAALPLKKNDIIKPNTVESSTESTPPPLNRPTVLTGKVKPLIGSITSVSPWSNSFSAWAATHCTDPKVGIYKTADLLKLGVSPLDEQPLDAKATFSFTPTAEIDLTRPQDYILQVTGCDNFYARIITAFDSQQNILLSSTLLSFSQVSPVNISPTKASNSAFATLLAFLEKHEDSYTNIEDVFNELSNSAVTAAFTTTFKGSTPEQLKYSLPVIREISIPTNISEGTLSLSNVDAIHWSPDYIVGVEWFLNGVSTSFGNTWNWTPPGNSKPTVQISMRIGRKMDSQDKVDTSFPYHQLSFTRNVENTISPLAPALNLNSTILALTNTPHLPLQINTGVGLANCSSFTSMAITETPTSPDLADFNILCAQDGFQDHSYSLKLTNRMDGNKTLYLWAKDDLDDISSTPSILNFTLDQSAPVLVFNTISALRGGNTNLTLNWNVSEPHATAAENFKIDFFDGSTWLTLPDVSSITGNLNNSLFSTTHLLPDSDVTNARYRISYKDILGHQTTITSNNFNIRTPNLLASPLSHNFGDVAALSSSPNTTITFTNSGEWASVACSSPNLTGDLSQFSIISESCSGSSLNIGASCQVVVRANPATRTAYNAQLNLSCGTRSSQATLTVTGGNNPPVLALTSSSSLNEDSIHNFTLPSATDIDGDSLVYSIISSPSHGTLTNCLGGTNDLSCTFTPSLNYNGNDSFTFQAYDGFNYSAPQTVTLTINPVNDAPTLAGPQSISGDEDTIINFVLNAGVDIENDPLSYIAVTNPTQGNLSCSLRNCAYTPNADYNGLDSFTYKVNDGNLDSNIVTVNITINPINDAPITASDLAISVLEDTAKNFSLNTGTDIDIPAQTLTYVLVTSPQHGSLNGCIESGPSTNTSCTYTPEADYFGSDSFTYKVCDPLLCSTSVTTVNLTIDPLNDAPVMVADQSFSLNDTQFIDFNLNGATDIDVPAQPLTYKLVSAPTSGVLSDCIDNASWSNNISCRFTPPSNFNGAISFTYQAFDGEAQSAGISTVTFNISDKTPPVSPVVALASPEITNLVSVSLTNTSCSDIDALYVSTNSTTPNTSAPEWFSCTTVSGALHATISAVNSSQTIYVWSKDQYGNVQDTPGTVDVIYDDIAPSIVIETQTLLGNDSGNVRFNISELHASISDSIAIRYNDGNGWSSWTIASANGPLVQQQFLTSVLVPNVHEGELLFEVKFKDIAGNEGSALATLHSDLSPPVMTSLSINSGSTFTSNNNIQAALSANDSTSNVRFFCLKYNDSTTPAADSNCWKNVTAPSPGIAATKSITFSGYYFQVGFIKATYTIYAWVKDDAGLISSNTQTNNVDKYEIEYDPGTPPRILALEVINSDSASKPYQPSDLIVDSGDEVFVKWKAEDTEGFSSTPISLEYTTNDVDFTPIIDRQNLLNAINGSCTIDGQLTGCATFPAPTNGYFKIRLIAKDEANTTAYMNSDPLNNSRLKIIAGNTEHGLGGSAATAVYYPYGAGKNVSHHIKHKLAVSEDGKFFYLDPQRGLLWIDPSTGSLKVFIPTTGANTGNGGPISSATLVAPIAITLDAYNHLLIWDNDQIRRVNLSTMTIKHHFGGGAITNPASLTSASDFKMGWFDNLWGVLIPLPNGDIIFSPETGTRNLYRYRSADQLIEPMILSGQGFDGDPSANWDHYGNQDFAVSYDTATSAINFMAKGFYRAYVGDAFAHYVRILPTGDATTPYPSTPPYDLDFMRHSVFTALDGKLYLIDRFRTTLYAYDPATNAKIHLLGTGGIGANPCPDDTPAKSCAVDMDTVFISKNGRIYLLDSGVIRTVDDSGNIITLFGQFPSYGNGQLATIARFGNIIDLKIGKHSAQNDKLIVSDGFSSEYREIQIEGAVTGLGENQLSWAGPWRFETDPVTGDIFAPRNGILQRLIRLTDTWTDIVGGGPNHYPNADGKIGSEIYFNGYANYTSGFVDGKLYYRPSFWTGSATNGCFIKAYDVNDSYRQSHFTGRLDCGGGLSAGDDIANQGISTSHITTFNDPTDGVKKLFFTENSKIYKVSPTNTVEDFLTLPRGIPMFAHKVGGDGLNFFYCSSEKLYQYNYNSGTETQLSWPSATMKCKESVIYNPERNSVIFSFRQNGLDGVAEYLLN